MLKKIEDMNHYELLEVSPRATAQEIHKAYERIRKIYDPNSIALYSLFSPEETEKIRQRVEDAYRTLIYEENRRVYDLTLRDYIDTAITEQAPPPPAAIPSTHPAAPMRDPAAPPAVPPAASVAQPVPHAPEALTALPIEPLPADVKEFTGPVLRMLREQRSLSTTNVAAITKLSTRYVEGIEGENYTKLPARPYLRGFLVLYVKAIGYEPDRVVADYMKRYDLAKNPPKK